MYMETSIIRNNKVIEHFDFYPNAELDIYLRAHERSEGGDDWFCITELTKKEIDQIKKYDKENIFTDLKEGDTIDILLHFTVIIKK